MKQTAVDWFVKQLQSNSDIRWRGTKINELAEQANAMFEQQIKDAFNDGMLDTDNENIIFLDGKEYYKETYEQ